MGTTYLHAVASLDGYIADEHYEVGPLHSGVLHLRYPVHRDRQRRESQPPGTGQRG